MIGEDATWGIVFAVIWALWSLAGTASRVGRIADELERLRALAERRGR